MNASSDAAPKPSIAIIPGSPLGEQALTALAADLDHLRTAATVTMVDVGADAYRRHGVALPDAQLKQLRNADAIVLVTPPVAGGGDDDIPAGVLERGIVLALRKVLRLDINLRSFRSRGSAAEVDIAVVREISEGRYSSPGVVLRENSSEEVAMECSITSRPAAERALRFAFVQAERRRRQLVLAHKPSVLVASGQVWTRALEAVAIEFPAVKGTVENIDDCCNRVITNPTLYDVIVTDNSFGDILSDVVSARSGAADYSVSKEFPSEVHGGPSLFEPMHSAARDITSVKRGVVLSLHEALSHIGLVSLADGWTERTTAP